MFTYSAYNLGISSELPLPEFIPAGWGGDIIVRVSQTIQTDEAKFQINDQEAVVNVINVGRFIVRCGREIIVYPHLNGDSELIRRFIVGTIMGIALYQRGNLVLHASSIQTSKGAIAFIGNVGMGKSTMALAMVSKGYNFITDDVCAIEELNGVYYIIPSYPLVKVSQEVADNILQNCESLRFVTRYDDKLEYQISDKVVTAPVPVNRIYMLNNQGDGNHERIDPQIAVLEILKNSFPTRFGHPGDKAHFLQCVELVRTTPIFNLKRANSIGDLSDTTRLIEEHMLKDY